MHLHVFTELHKENKTINSPNTNFPTKYLFAFTFQSNHKMNIQKSVKNVIKNVYVVVLTWYQL